MGMAELEKRLQALEVEVAELRRRLQGKDVDERPWWEKIAGTFAGDRSFLEAMKLGREYRESLRPKKARRSRR